MKKIFSIFIIGLLLQNCSTAPKIITYQIKGKIADNDGKNIELSKFDKDLKSIPLDTVQIKDSIFSFTVPQQTPDIAMLTITETKQRIPVIIGDGDIVVDVKPMDLYNSDFSKSTSGLTKKFYEYQKHSKKDQFKGKEITLNYRRAATDKARDSIKKAFENWQKDAEKYQYDYIENNKDIVGLIIMKTLLSSPESDFEKIRKSFETYPEAVKKLPLGKNINTTLLTVGATKIGGKAPNFISTTIDGKKLSLTQAMGKVTIIDFWASWCRPCRNENPYMVQIYNKYHDQGLNIIGVSLDGNKISWQRAIDDDGIKWQQVSSLKKWQEPVAKLYGVMSIPQTFILDSKGIIRAKNLRREELEAKIKELINE